MVLPTTSSIQLLETGIKLSWDVPHCFFKPSFSFRLLIAIGYIIRHHPQLSMNNAKHCKENMRGERVISPEPEDLELTQIKRIMRGGNCAMIRWLLFRSGEGRASLYGWRAVTLCHSVLSAKGLRDSCPAKDRLANGWYSPSYWWQGNPYKERGGEWTMICCSLVVCGLCIELEMVKRREVRIIIV